MSDTEAGALSVGTTLSGSGYSGTVQAITNVTGDRSIVQLSTAFTGGSAPTDLSYSVPAEVTLTGTYGTLLLNNSGEYTYTLTAANPPNGSVDSFSYKIADPDAATDTAVLNITILRSAVTPVAVVGTTVNEASGYVLFTVEGTSGQNVRLDLVESGVIAGHADLGTDVVDSLQYFNGTSWQSYTDSSLTIDVSGKLFVRAAVLQDKTSEGSESIQLNVINADNSVSSGLSYIVDNGSGTLYNSDSFVSGVPATATGTLDDDRPFTVSSISVNEASPHAVFEITGAVGQILAGLSVTGATATIDVDFNSTLQYFDGTNWQTFVAGTTAIPADGKLLVRVGVFNDGAINTGLYEGAETFVLNASNTGGGTFTGVAAILDDGTGSIFSTADGTEDTLAEKDRDSSVTVTSLGDVNEASTYAFFNVKGNAGVPLMLSLNNLSAELELVAGAENEATIEYWNGTTAWSLYTYNETTGTGNKPTPLDDGDGTGTFVVRVKIVSESDTTYEISETFELVATTIATGTTLTQSSSATTAIKDDGTGTIFNDDGSANNSAVLDDDRALSVNSFSVNENSPHAVFTVTGVAGQLVQLALGNTSDVNDTDATLGTDTGNAGTGVPLQYFNGTAWVDYTASSYVAIPAGGTTLLVRTAITDDTSYEIAETFTLLATNTGGTAAEGIATIRDDGTGTIFNDDGSANNSAVLDDDRALSVNSFSVNENSPHAVFTVTGVAGQLVQLALGNTSDVNDTDATLGTDTGNAGTGVPLQYFNGTAWVDYTASSYVAIPAGGTTLLVRTAITDDTSYEIAETFTLLATNTGGTAAEGIATIRDDGTGTIFNDDGSANNSAVLDDDRALSVNSFSVNENSPHAVFTVTGVAGQLVQLALGNTSDVNDTDATLGTDTGNAGTGVPLQYFNGTAWVDYTASSYVAIPAGGTTLLVRTAITDDTSYEIAETFTLLATNTGGTAAEGIATIRDDGTGTIFNDDGSANNSAVLDDDRALSVNSFSVNENSPHAVFTVTGVAGQLVQLALGNTSDVNDTDATLGTDTGNAGTGVPLQYFNGTAWVDYTASSYVAIPAGGTTLLVRTAITDDTSYEIAETFTLLATNTGGTAAEGIATIRDDGTGTIFNDDGSANNSAVLDDDRALSVNSFSVNENSPHAVFTVTGVAGQLVQLALGNTSDVNDTDATLGTDTGNAGTGVPLQYFNGTAWVDYTASSYVAIPAGGTTLLVRTAITDDTSYEIAETFTLLATNTGGTAAEGIATIRDDGTGTIFNDDGSANNSAVLDDDRALSVNSFSVNENSPHAVFTVTGVAGQLVQLALGNTSDVNDTDATLGTDTGNAGTGVPLQYFNGTAWVDYTASSYVAIPAGGTTLLVRTAITDDTSYEIAETFTLLATNTGGTAAEGIATIRDDGTGTIFNDDGSANNSAVLDDDRALSVNSFSVNENSPHAVFTVTGVAGQLVQLALGNTSDVNDTDATLGTDTGNAGTGVPLQYFNGTAWVDYTASSYVAIPAGGTTLLVRTAITDDTSYEIAETFTLLATNTGGTAAEGIATIRDDGTGTIFNDDGSANNSAVLDDDRALSVNSFSVNENSPHAVFTVTGVAGQLVQLALGNTSDVNDTDATLGTDTGNAGTGVPLQYFNGTAWVDYTASSYVAIPAGGTTLLVRTAITDDTSYEIAETFTLLATNTGGTAAEGIATIRDDGTGTIFNDDGSANNSAVLDDDRALSVNSFSVNENSPHAVFTVTGVAGQLVQLALGNTSDVNDTDATLGTDTGNAGTGVPLQYFNGTAWVDYTASSYVAIPAGGTTLLVRTAITDDTSYEIAETFTLLATNTGGTAAEGIATIRDDGTGTIFNDDGSANNSAVLDDDRALSVNSFSVNENSPHAVFTVTGVAGQLVQLALGNTSDVNDTDATLGTDTGNAGTGVPLQYFNGTAWVDYTASSYVAIPAGGTTLLVRTAITDDTSYEIAETFTLLATNTGGTAAEGIATIRDDGTGTIFNDDGSANNSAVLDDDRALSVNSFSVNENSPHAVFTVTGVAGQLVQLALGNTSDVNDTDATLGTDTGNAGTGVPLQYFNGTAWVDYTASSYVAIPAGGTTLLVRTAITDDTSYEIAETFTLLATNTGGTAAEGIATIRDDGTGTIFNDDGSANNSAVLDDDRALSVNSFSVNENSPHAVFTVTGVAGQLVQLALGNTSDVNDTDATLGTDTGNAGTGVPLQYFNGTAWVDYTASSYVAIPAGGTTLLVRTAITDDTSYEIAETFTLLATNTGGTAAEGIATIRDDGTGTIFNDDGSANNSAVLDDDRALSVNSFSVNENSPHAVFTVTGVAGQLVQLALGNTSDVNDTDATLGTDTGNAGTGVPLQYFNGTAWVDYTASSYVAIPAGGTTLLVRTAITDDTSYEIAETFTLLATNTGGTAAEGIATIRDDGTGTIFNDDGSANNSAVLDDDRALSVNSFSVNENSPHAVFTVTGVAGQLVQLALGNTSDVNDTDATLGTDTGNAGTGVPLQYFNGTAWVDYTASSYVAIPAGGTTLLVRTAITDDTSYEIAETFTLLATNTGGTAAEGIATIRDDGTGTIFNDDGSANNSAVLDDDRALSVNSFSVNENSPHAVFTVTGVAGQLVQLALGNTSDVNDTDATLGTDTGNAGTGVPLQYFNGTAWVDYTASSYVAIPAGGTTLLVRTAITDDTSYEIAETFTLLATNTGGTAAEGIATIRDDGTGTIFNDDGTPNTDAVKDDDRAVTVTSPIVNEGSPFAVFTVSGAADQLVKLSLSDVTTEGLAGLQYYDASANSGAGGWVAYEAESYVALNASGKLFVRTSLTAEQEAAIDNGETFTLTATNTGETGTVGTATVKDDGTGTYFPDVAPNEDGTPAIENTIVLKDDRAILVSSPTVNEASPYAFFTLTGAPNQVITLALTDGTATSSDYGSLLQYSVDGGSTWVTYTGGNITLSASSGTMLVRTPINQDTTNEPDETFSLKVTNTGGGIFEGVATIQDDGNGTVFNDDGTENTLAIRDDDRAISLPTITLSSLTVSEAAPFANFTVTLSSATASDISFKPVLAGGTAVVGVDTGSVLQYFDGANWIDVGTDGVTILAGQRTLNMRFALVQDSDFNEGTENVFVSTGAVVGVQNASGATGIINITDVKSLRDPVIIDVLETPTDPTPFDLLTAKGDDQLVTVVGESASLVTLFSVFDGGYTQVTGVSYVTTEISPGLYVLNFTESLIEAGEYVVKLSKQNYESNYSNSFTVDSRPGLYDIAGLRKNVLVTISGLDATEQVTEGGVGGMDQNRFPSFWNGTNWLDSDGQVIRFNVDALLLFDPNILPDAVSVTKTVESGSSLTLNTRTGLYIYNPSETATIDIFTLTASDGNKGSTLTLTFDAKDTLDRDGISGAVESRLSDLVQGGSGGDLNNDGIRDELQNAVTTLAWITFNDFNAGINGSLNETKPIITLQVVDSLLGNRIDASSQLANVSVLSEFDEAVGGSKPENARWDPIQFSIEPLQSMGLLDADPNREGVQLRTMIDISRSDVAEGGFNAYMKYVPQATIDSYALAGM